MTTATALYDNAVSYRGYFIWSELESDDARPFIFVQDTSLGVSEHAPNTYWRAASVQDAERQIDDWQDV
jgi:hypothetical protein